MDKILKQFDAAEGLLAQPHCRLNDREWGILRDFLLQALESQREELIAEVERIDIGNNGNEAKIVEKVIQIIRQK